MITKNEKERNEKEKEGKERKIKGRKGREGNCREWKGKGDWLKVEDVISSVTGRNPGSNDRNKP